MGSRTRKLTVNYRKLAGIEADFDETVTCALCTKVIHPINEAVQIDQTLLSDGCNALENLQKTLDDVKFHQAQVLCPKCLELLHIVVDLREELDKAKKKLISVSQITNENQAGKNGNTEVQTKGEGLKQKKSQKPVMAKESKNPQLFKCEYEGCGKSFTRKASLLEHSARHKGIREKECPICHKRFFSTSYWRHMSTVHAQEDKLVFHCKVPNCHKKFAQKYRLLLHEKSHLAYDQREYLCQRCPDNKRFATKNRFRSHLKQVHDSSSPDESKSKGTTSKLCPSCGIWISSGSMNAHRKRHHSPSKSEEAVATTTEEECYLKFDSSQSMQNHIESQHGDANKAAVVSNDWRGLGIPSSYATTDQHENRGDAQMEIAGIVGHEEIVQPHFANEVLLAQTDDSNVSHPSHELLAAAESGNALIVSGPEDSSTSLMLLSSFMPGYDFDHQSATGLPEIGTNPQVEQVFPQHNQPQTQPPTLTSGGAIIGSFSCSLCQKKFASQKAKNQHERLVHAKGAVHTCHICHRGFVNAQYLKEHLRVHSPPTFFCDYHGCGKSFRLGKDLKRHKRVHTGEKPFRCEVCGKCFAASSNLSEHRTLHTGARPYQCRSCHKHFRLWSSLRKHTIRCPSSAAAAAKKSNTMMMTANDSLVSADSGLPSATVIAKAAAAPATVPSSNAAAAVLVFDLPKALSQ